MVERRNKKRKEPEDAWRVVHRKTGQLLGHVANITCEGMMVRGEGPLPIDEIINLRIELPIVIDGSQEFDCDAVSLWSDRGSNPRYYNTGLQLLNLSEQDIRMIERIMERCPI